MEGLRRWLAEILWPKLHELDVICEMNRVAADVVNGEWRKDRDRVGVLERKVKRLENEDDFKAAWNLEFHQNMNRLWKNRVKRGMA